ncbi:MAG: alginate lyase family protein [Verrucomicrobiota bacterium]
MSVLPEGRPAGSPIRVAIVEDNDENRGMLERVVGRASRMWFVCTFWLALGSRNFMRRRSLTCTSLLAALLGLGTALAPGQSLLMSDDFEATGTNVSSTLWPYSSGTRVESGQAYFGSANRYFHVAGANVKAMSANWGPNLKGKTSTFAFDFYEPSSAGDSTVVGYTAGTSDINTAGAYVRISIGSGAIVFDATDGTAQTNSGLLTYPRNTRLTFSLALNDSTAAQPFNGASLPPKTLDVWYYDWSRQQAVYALSIDVSASTRSPVCVGFRTFSASTSVQAYVDNAKLVDALTVVTPAFVPPEPPPVVIVPVRPFEHPSLFNSQQELDRLKYRVSHETGTPVVSGWNQLRASSYASLSYTPVPYSNVVVVSYGSTASESQFRQDAHAARAAALQWAMTGDTRYRDHAISILNAWSAVFTLMSPGSNTSSGQIELEAAWAAPIWVSAADIIRYYNHGTAGWSAADITRFSDRILNYLYNQSALAAGVDSNWGASAALAMIMVGAYQENRARFDAGVQTWRDRFAGINSVVGNNGYINEVCRDTWHPQYTLQVWMQAAEVAWKQGIDLYSTPLSGSTTPQYPVILENFADLFLGYTQPPCDASFLTSYNYRGDQLAAGAYDIGYNHYVIRAGMTNLPHFADMIVNHWRPGGEPEHFCCWSTFTHGNLSAGIPAVSGLGVWNIQTNGWMQLFSDGDTLNVRDLGTAASVAVQTTGVVSWVQYYTNGTTLGLASSNAPFRLATLPRPGNWFLSAVGSRALTGGSIPGDPWTRFVRVVDLPAPWVVHDLGAAAVPAWAAENAGTMTAVSAGTNVAGTDDQAGLLSATITGDAQITARLSLLSSARAATRAGLMFREGTGAGSRGVFLGAAPFGSNFVSFVSRAQKPGTAVVTNVAVAAGSAWLRLVRLGNAVCGYSSTDGTSWSLLASNSLPMNPTLEAGLCVASGAADQPATAVFTNVLVEPLGASYAEWQNWVFTARGITNAALTGPNADPDGDGRSNLAEYWLGSDPLSADTVPAVKVIGMTSGPALRVQYRERKNAADLGRVFQSATDLIGWNTVAATSITDLQDLGSVVVREVLFPVSSTNTFYRARYGP